MHYHFSFLQKLWLNSSYSHVIHFRWVGEGKELCHIEPGCAVCISKIKAPPLLQIELMGI